MDPRLGRINELWEKKLTTSMRIEDKDFRNIDSDGMNCWEFTYQQIESTTMSQFEFDKINSRDEIDRKTAKGYRDSPRGDFSDFDFDFDFDFFLIRFNVRHLHSPSPRFFLIPVCVAVAIIANKVRFYAAAIEIHAKLGLNYMCPAGK